MNNSKSSRAPVISPKPMKFWGFWLWRCLLISAPAIIVRSEKGEQEGDVQSREGSLEIPAILNYFIEILDGVWNSGGFAQVKVAGGAVVSVPARVALLGVILWHFLLFQRELPLNNSLLSTHSILISAWFCFIDYLLISPCFSTLKFWWC